MTLKTEKPATPCKAATGSGYVLSPTDRSSGYSTFPILLQERIDVVAWIAARANVATATARVHAELFGIGGVA